MTSEHIVSAIMTSLFFGPFIIVVWALAIRAVYLMTKGKWPWE